MEFMNRDFAASSKADFATERKSGRLDMISDDVVDLDIESLSSPVASAGEKGSNVCALTPFQNSLSRKGSQRGGERKPADMTAAAITASTDGESSNIVIHVAREGDATTLPPATTPTSIPSGGGGRCRRSAYRRPSRWINPRRVLVFFAALSSMGTLILLYFTLSMAKMPAGDANER